VADEIFHWNEVMPTGSKSRLMRAGRRVDAPELGLEEGHIATLVRLVAEPEATLARQGRVTLLFAARDEVRNEAVVLREVLLG